MAEHDKTLRIIYTLQLLTSRRPRTAADLQRALEERGYKVTKRTIERDLQALMANPTLGPNIECNEREKPYGWKLKRDAELILPQLELHSHIETGVFDISAGKGSQCSVKLRFYNGAGEHLLESPIEEEQIPTRIDNDTLELTVTTHDSHEFRWWLLGFGGHVEVLEPKPLREAIGGQLTEAAARYSR